MEWRAILRSIPKINDAIATRGGLRLGLTEPETESILGSPTSIEGNERRYDFKTHRMVHTEIPNENEDWEITGEITLMFSNHHLAYIAVSRSEIW
jgi:hypothetical protein